ncbi:type II secretion system protein [Colwellia piezophila]|uniref:type II secretion system protein n=1 Tax=Colwellia piezophila TaxID=211668 RepID=UPI00036DC09A|nr:prepilin-type N-terminal cleavage/methylation domain-containing protein [Colwellia piezophila]
MSAKGFTLIELVIVIVILGILSVTALPRFINLTQDAHDSVAHATFSSFESAVALYHNCWIAKSAPGHVKDLACFGSGDIDSTPTGYPLGQDTATSDSDMDGKVLNGANCEELWHGLLDDEFQLAIHSDAAFTAENDIVYWFTAYAVNLPDTHCYYNYISDNPAKGQENWQMRYYPGTGKVTVGKATLG